MQDDRIQATLLYPHRRDVDDENTKRLADLSGTSVGVPADRVLLSQPHKAASMSLMLLLMCPESLSSARQRCGALSLDALAQLPCA
jgi:hypothetical protein